MTEVITIDSDSDEDVLDYLGFNPDRYQYEESESRNDVIRRVEAGALQGSDIHPADRKFVFGNLTGREFQQFVNNEVVSIFPVVSKEEVIDIAVYEESSLDEKYMQLIPWSKYVGFSPYHMSVLQFFFRYLSEHDDHDTSDLPRPYKPALYISKKRSDVKKENPAITVHVAPAFSVGEGTLVFDVVRSDANQIVALVSKEPVLPTNLSPTRLDYFGVNPESYQYAKSESRKDIIRRVESAPRGNSDIHPSDQEFVFGGRTNKEFQKFVNKKAEVAFPVFTREEVQELADFEESSLYDTYMKLLPWSKYKGFSEYHMSIMQAIRRHLTENVGGEYLDMPLPYKPTVHKSIVRKTNKTEEPMVIAHVAPSFAAVEETIVFDAVRSETNQVVALVAMDPVPATDSDVDGLDYFGFDPRRYTYVRNELTDVDSQHNDAASETSSETFFDVRDSTSKELPDVLFQHYVHTRAETIFPFFPKEDIRGFEEIRDSDLYELYENLLPWSVYKGFPRFHMSVLQFIFRHLRSTGNKAYSKIAPPHKSTANGTSDWGKFKQSEYEIRQRIKELYKKLRLPEVRFDLIFKNPNINLTFKHDRYYDVEPHVDFATRRFPQPRVSELANLQLAWVHFSSIQPYNVDNQYIIALFGQKILKHVENYDEMARFLRDNGGRELLEILAKLEAKDEFSESDVWEHDEFFIYGNAVPDLSGENIIVKSKHRRSSIESMSPDRKKLLKTYDRLKRVILYKNMMKQYPKVAAAAEKLLEVEIPSADIPTVDIMSDRFSGFYHSRTDVLSKKYDPNGTSALHWPLVVEYFKNPVYDENVIKLGRDLMRRIHEGEELSQSEEIKLKTCMDFWRFVQKDKYRYCILFMVYLGDQWFKKYWSPFQTSADIHYVSQLVINIRNVLRAVKRDPKVKKSPLADNIGEITVSNYVLDYNPEYIHTDDVLVPREEWPKLSQALIKKHLERKRKKAIEKFRASMNLPEQFPYTPYDVFTSLEIKSTTKKRTATLFFDNTSLEEMRQLEYAVEKFKVPVTVQSSCDGDLYERRPLLDALFYDIQYALRGKSFYRKSFPFKSVLGQIPFDGAKEKMQISLDNPLSDLTGSNEKELEGLFDRASYVLKYNTHGLYNIISIDLIKGKHVMEVEYTSKINLRKCVEDILKQIMKRHQADDRTIEEAMEIFDDIKAIKSVVPPQGEHTEVLILKKNSFSAKMMDTDGMLGAVGAVGAVLRSIPDTLVYKPAIYGIRVEAGETKIYYSMNKDRIKEGLAMERAVSRVARAVPVAPAVKLPDSKPKLHDDIVTDYAKFKEMLSVDPSMYDLRSLVDSEECKLRELSFTYSVHVLHAIALKLDMLGMSYIAFDPDNMDSTVVKYMKLRTAFCINDLIVAPELSNPDAILEIPIFIGFAGAMGNTGFPDHIVVSNAICMARVYLAISNIAFTTVSGVYQNPAGGWLCRLTYTKTTPVGTTDLQ